MLNNQRIGEIAAVALYAPENAMYPASLSATLQPPSDSLIDGPISRPSERTKPAAVNEEVRMYGRNTRRQ